MMTKTWSSFGTPLGTGPSCAEAAAAKAMAERFVNRFPVASQWMSRTGQFTGLPEHAERLLEDDRLVLVFPEGARGTAKLYWERHSLVEFGSGFVRLALATDTPQSQGNKQKAVCARCRRDVH